MELITAMLKEEEKYRDIVGVHPGEYVLISGKMKTAAKVWTKNSDDQYFTFP